MMDAPLARLLAHSEEYSECTNLSAFTLNPDPSRYNSDDPVVQYEQLLQDIFLKEKHMCATFSVYAFVPEMTENGNVHIHGYYIVKDRVKYYRWFLPKCKSWGYIKVKTTNVNKKWLTYCQKEVMEHYPLFDPPYVLETDQIHRKKNIKLVPNHLHVYKRRKAKNILDYFK